MKKFFSIICVLIISCVLFVGCGVSGSNALVSIKFTQPVFYVDENCPTELSYNIYPSTASNFGKATISTSSQVFGKLVDGVITTDNKFTDPITATIQAGAFTDSCFVVNKSLAYPTSITLEHPNLDSNTIALSAGSSTTLQLNGNFSKEWKISEDGKSVSLANVDSSKKVAVNQEIFNIKLISSDPSIVEIVDSQKLQVRGVSSGVATITAYLVDDCGNEKNPAYLKSTINVEVFNLANQLDVYFNNSAIENSIPSSASRTLNTNDAFVFNVYVKDAENQYITSDRALKLVNCLVLGNEGLTVLKSLETKLDIRCVKIEIKNTSSSSITTTISDKLLISCDGVLSRDTLSVNRIIALG
ncbi:MAG: hypothetical protein IJT25_03945 [Clostridia bacterium]|nr:hypothetical protein [Clostridia bacterium]